MIISPQERMLVQDSFEKMMANSDTAADLFYPHLFEVAPQLQPLFAEANMGEQGRKLMNMIAAVVGSLNDMHRVLPEIKEMGERHVNYGVKPEHYPILGETLLWTIEQVLGDEFTPAAKEAWANVYKTIVDVATQDAYE